VCGIAGFAGVGSWADLERMAQALAHRGPDGAGFFVDEATRVFLGHRRLAIVDVAGGEQPMWNEDGQVGVVFNGEIYNHADLRADLQRRGHRFASDHSDTEVLVHGYEEWGEGLPLRLNGMFAFAILDRRRNQIFLARDRFGEKPLYYTAKPGLFAFASELTALAEHPGVSRSIDSRAQQKFFAYGYLPAPHATLEGVRKLPGGHWLRYELGSGAIAEKPYWRFVLEPDDSLRDADEPRLVEECGALLTEAARRRLMSDVPLGVFLSGGLDSSVVLASLAKALPAECLGTFTIGFDEPSFDESEHALAVARHLGTSHHARRLDLARACNLIPSVLCRLDEPLGDASLLPTYLLSAFAREKVTVVLSGDGGDELFAGYDPFLALAPAVIYSRLMPRWGHKGLRRLADLIPISHANMGLDFKLRRSLIGLSHAASMWLPIWMAPLDPRDAAELFESPLTLEDLYDEAIAAWESDPAKNPVDRGLEFFTRFYLQDDLLMKVDRAAMMCSLEARAVFLDNDLVEFCRRLPHRFKFRNGERKYLLKKVARRLLPPSIVDRKKKGFGIPLAKWLREVPPEPPMAPLAGVRADYARRAFAEHRSGAADHRLFLWSWIAMQGFADHVATLAAGTAHPHEATAAHRSLLD
jgi:asparagine synthase (glutamine-hydrolysing)